MGRPPIGQTAMTAAERMRRSRAKRAAERAASADVPSHADYASRIRALEREIQKLRRQLAARSQKRGSPTNE